MIKRASINNGENQMTHTTTIPTTAKAAWDLILTLAAFGLPFAIIFATAR